MKNDKKVPKKNDKKVPKKIEKLIFQEAGSACPFCGESKIVNLDVHHIKSRADGGSNEPENLILACKNCHSEIENKGISEFEVHRMKKELVRGNKRHLKSTEPNKSITLNNSVNTGLIAQNLTINTSKPSKIKIPPPEGAIATDLHKRNYIKRLIGRFNKFKKADKNVKNFRPQIIYAAIDGKFKCTWDMIPIEKFSELVVYLQGRIDRTILGKNRKSKKQKNYSTFDEFLAEMK